MSMSAEGLNLRQVEAESFQSALEFAFGAVGDLSPGFGAPDVQVSLVGMLRSPAMHFDFDLAGEFAAQIINVDSCASIQLRRIFSRE